MNYPRPPYLAPGIPTEKGRVLFSDHIVDVPKIDYPVTALENFKLAAAHKTPYWVPNTLLDIQTLYSQDLGLGRQQGPDYDHMDKDYEFNDLFHIPWTWVASAGGPMLTPGTQFLDDITNWETGIKWPDLNEWDWDTPAKEFLKNKYDPTKVLNINIGQGVTERLVALLGGYTESMMALAIEPEAVRDFSEAFADFTIKFFDNLIDRYPITMVQYHDDWGTERDTFFSEKMMEELFFAPSKRIIDHIKSKGVIFMLHSCGNIKRFVPHMIDMGVDFMQIQRRANDTPAYKVQYGDKIGIDGRGIEGVEPGQNLAKEVYLEKVRNTVDLYGKNGGYFTTIPPEPDPERTWDGIWELYSYSREYYDKERAKESK